MKLHPDRNDGLTVTGLAEGWIAVNGERHTTHLLLDSRGGCTACQLDTQAPWDSAAMTTVVNQTPELLILGSGRQQRFPPPQALRELMSRRIGFETMDTAAACRTYNILAGEGRHVMALLVLPALPDT